MLQRLTLLLLLMSLSACGESRLNPFNWFGVGRSEPSVIVADTQPELNPLIPAESGPGLVGLFVEQEAPYPGTAVDQISALNIDRVPGGAIIRASGVTDFQGAFGVRLWPANEDEEAVDGILTYRLEAVRPSGARVGGPERVRTVTAARRVTDNQLDGVRVIRVEGRRNAQVSSRR